MSNKGEDIFIKFKRNAAERLGVADPTMRSPMHLSDKIPELVEGTGWEVLLLWDQVAPLSAY